METILAGFELERLITRVNNYLRLRARAYNYVRKIVWRAWVSVETRTYLINAPLRLKRFAKSIKIFDRSAEYSMPANRSALFSSENSGEIDGNHLLRK